MFDFSLPGLLLGTLFSLIGWQMFRFGAREGETPKVVFGLALLIFPFAVGSTWWTLGLGSGLLAAPFLGDYLGLW